MKIFLDGERLWKMETEEDRKYFKSCYACGSSKIKKLSFNVSGSIIVCRCKVCGLKALDLEEPLNNFDEYWNDVNEKIYCQQSVIKEATRKFNKYINVIKKMSPPNTTLLDVGSGAGIFSNSAVKSNFDVTGVEPSSRAVNIARSRYSLNIVCGLLEPEDNLSRNFGIITSWDVIEHVPNPELFVEICSAHLAENGILLLETPDEGSFFRLAIHTIALISFGGIDFRPKIYYRDHRQYFTRKSIKFLLERLGFESVKIFTGYTMFEKSLMKLQLYCNYPKHKLWLMRGVYFLLRLNPLFANKMIIVCKKAHPSDSDV